MTLRQLEYFIAAADAGSITAAAQRVHISQPSISAAIAQLEAELGVDLFLRKRAQGLVLTAAGHKIAERARSILSQSLDLYDLASREANAMRGRITLGCLTTLAPLIAPELCHVFMRQNPGVDFAFDEGSQDHLIAEVKRGQIDIAITYEMQIPSDVAFERLVDLPPYVMLGAGHRLARAASIDLREVAADPYVLLDLPLSRDYFRSVFDAAGLAPNIATRTTQQEVVRTMVANGYGISIAVSRPVNQAALDGRPIVSLPIANPVPRLAIGLLSPSQGQTRLITAFKQHCRTMIGADGVPGMALPG